MRVVIRPGVPSDIDWLTDQLRAFSRFMETRLPVFGDDNLVKSGLATMIENHVVRVAEREDCGPMGFIGGLYGPHPFNPNIRLLTETFWWVSEEHRGSRAGLLLLQDFIDHGKKTSDWVSVALEAKSPVDERCLTRRGFRHLESSYLLEVS